MPHISEKTVPSSEYAVSYSMGRKRRLPFVAFIPAAMPYSSTGTRVLEYRYPGNHSCGPYFTDFQYRYHGLLIHHSMS